MSDPEMWIGTKWLWRLLVSHDDGDGTAYVTRSFFVVAPIIAVVPTDDFVIQLDPDEALRELELEDFREEFIYGFNPLTSECRVSGKMAVAPVEGPEQELT